jgi:hypothetical protein
VGQNSPVHLASPRGYARRGHGNPLATRARHGPQGDAGPPPRLKKRLEWAHSPSRPGTCPGHPRLFGCNVEKDVDARDQSPSMTNSEGIRASSRGQLGGAQSASSSSSLAAGML